MSRPRFKLSARGAALAMVSAAFAGPALANTAGRIDFVIGEANVRGVDGRVRAAAKGDPVQDGDTLLTGSNGRAQIRFSDGAYVSLQPNTEFGVREYRFDGKTDGSERGFFSLVRGAMRTVTGLIGRYNRTAYQVRTPTATVGIRGTGGLIAVLPDLSTLVKGTSGIWLLSNPAGQIEVPAGTSGLATPDLKVPPQQTSQSPAAPPPPPPAKEATYSEGDKTTETGDACSVTQDCGPGTTPPAAPPPPPPMISGPGYHVSFAYSGTTAGNSLGNSTGLADATFNATGQMTTYTDQSGLPVTLLGSHGEGGNVPGIVAWGRWTGQVTIGGATPTFGSNEGFHYVAGLPTPSMPTSGSATFTQVGATSPTTSDGTGGLGTATTSLTANFVSGAVTLNVNAAFSGWGYNVSIPGAISGQQMSGTLFGQFATGTPPSQYVCGACNCSASFNGAFFGAGASHAGVAYKIGPDFTSFAVTGAAALKQ